MKSVVSKKGHVRFKQQSIKISLLGLLFVNSLALPINGWAGPREQAKRIHDRLAGVPANAATLDAMATLLEQGDNQQAAYLAMDNPGFYSVTLKNWITPWTNEEADSFAPLNDYTATVIGITRDDVDFRQILSGNLLYVGNDSLNLPSYAVDNNDHYQALEDQELDLSSALTATTQTAVTGLPAEATAGVLTTRAAAKSFFKDGTNRAMFRFTLINHLCTDLEGVKDISRAPDRIRQDVSRSPGGDSRIFLNSCIGCHSGMDPLAQAFAYYDYRYDSDADPEGLRGRLLYNSAGQNDPISNSRVTSKHQINANNFPFGFIIQDDKWDNYWRAGQNKHLGWDSTLPGSGSGAKSMGQELANSQKFAQCQVKKVFTNVCLRDPQDGNDRAQVTQMISNFENSGFQIKRVFADAANYCKGS
ncbi:hypothetical protein [Aliiglaciecola sp. LCG003]|uniref:hypothetical protein n=1 Tax=Aliiglaciecola sp. LCG003 TaxID=3053655 RepID=UPI00257394BD|nr:hypothetical protein [Aliiglaciecola sp. LCG003]WJG08762.1 hypothetical protein QR722_15670 [Aliiglaciecola sp. LCG003]